MPISKEEVISSAIEVVSEALKGGIVPLCSIYTQLLLQNIKLEHERKRLLEGRLGDNSWKHEKGSDIIVQRENSFATEPLKQSSPSVCKGVFQSKEDWLSAPLQPLSGCRCYSCKYASLHKKKKKYRMKAKSENCSRLLNNNDFHWAIYRGITICEIIYIGHKNDKLLLDHNKIRRKVGATIRFPREDVREYFVPLHDLCFIEISEYRTKQTAYPNDSGYGASVACSLKVDLDLAIPSSSSAKNNSKSSTNSSFRRGLQLLSPNYLSEDMNDQKVSTNVPLKKKVSYSITHTGKQCQSFQSPNRSFGLRDSLKVSCIENRRCSLQDSANKCFSNLEFPRRTSNACKMFRSTSTSSETSRFDSAISLGTDIAICHCRSNQELCHCCLKLSRVRDNCSINYFLNSSCQDCYFSCRCDRQNHHSDYCCNCHSRGNKKC